MAQLLPKAISKNLSSLRLAGYSLTLALLVVGLHLAWGPNSLLAASQDVGVSTIEAPAINGRQFTSSTFTSAEEIAVTVSNFGPTPQSDVPVFYTLNGTTYGPEIVAGPIISGSSVVYTFTTVADLSTPGDYALSAGTNLPGDLEPGNDVVTTVIKQLANSPLTLPFFEGFENTGNDTYQENVIGLKGIEEVDYEHTQAEGRLRTRAGTGYYHSGSHAATLDRGDIGTGQINYLIFTLNMSNYDITNDDIQLDFYFMHHSDDQDAQDQVWVRGADTLPWIQIVDLFDIHGKTNPGVYYTVSDINVSQVLSDNNQIYGTSFQIRFGQEGDRPSIGTQSYEGYTFDDIQLRKRFDVDVGPSALLTPTQYSCGSATQPVVVEVTNLGNTMLDNIPVSVDVSGSDLLTGQVSGPIAFQETDTAVIGTIDTYQGGWFTFTTTTAYTSDMQTDNDILVTSLQVNPAPISVLSNQTTCSGESATLNVVSEPGITYAWYDSPTGNTPLAVGASWSTPPLLETTTYYVEREFVPSAQVGENEDPTLTGNASSPLSNGLIFDVLRPTIIDRVYVYPDAGGEVVVRLLDVSNSVLDTRTISVTAPGVKTSIPLGFNVPAGSGYRLDAVGTTKVGLYRGMRNDPDSYSYPYTSSLVNITGPINGSEQVYYFFYEWEVSSAACSGARTPVTVQVTSTGVHTTVSSIADSGPGSLRHAVANVCAGSVINFESALSGQTITLTNGAIEVTGNITVENSSASNLTISGNNASTIFQVGSAGSFSIDGLTLSGGLATNLNGGAIYNDGGMVNLNHMTLSNNVAQERGGGIYITNTGTVNIVNSALVGNRTNNGDGGGIYNDGGIVNIANSTLSENAAQESGGAIYNDAGSATLSSSTLSANVADRGGLDSGDGGGIFDRGGSVSVKDSIIAGNVDGSPGTQHPDLSGDFTSAGYNLVGNNQGVGPGGVPFVDGVNGDQVGTNAKPLDPMLDSLTGSPAYHPLQPASPAIDAGDPSGCDYLSTGMNLLFSHGELVTTDQRGLSRPQEAACDIGAFEFQPVKLSLTKTANPQLNVPLNGVVIYAIILSNTGSLDAPGTQLSDTLPDEVEFAHWIRQPAGASVANDQLTWTGAVSAGQAITFTFVVSHTGGYGDVVTNTVAYSHSNGNIGSDVASFRVVSEYSFYLPIVMKK